MKDIYKLDLHEATEAKNDYANNVVTRVAGGWIYHHFRLDCGQMTATFVPFNNEFQSTGD